MDPGVMDPWVKTLLVQMYKDLYFNLQKKVKIQAWHTGTYTFILGAETRVSLRPTDWHLRCRSSERSCIKGIMCKCWSKTSAILLWSVNPQNVCTDVRHTCTQREDRDTDRKEKCTGWLWQSTVNHYTHSESGFQRDLKVILNKTSS